ncbi:polysaccharide lyase domain-containing protein [Lachnospira pectinoschiza]|uniref:Pectate disaccharide-lyase n=1 Tax=Lachnospira pectinoschiza TaxID=28052 RepID=A0A1G9YD48_9FIRM|nr:hypothetical protein [Lachnospira pectinoschiza]SDN07069.1 hypothetical protein SAMN05216544_1794 [Lachnospira pectinoschiza]
MIKNFKKYKAMRIAASVMSALMVTSLVPTYLYVGNQSSIVAYAATASSESSLVTWSAADLRATIGADADSNLRLVGLWSTLTEDSSDEGYFPDGLAKANSTAKATENGSGAGTIPTSGAYLEYTATTNGTFTMDAKVSKNKTLYVVDSDGNIIVSKTAGSESSLYDTITFEVTGGKTYYAYVAGSKAQIWQATFKASEVTVDAESLFNTTSSATATQGFILRGDGWSKNDATATDSGTFTDGLAIAGANVKALANGSGNGAIPTSGTYLEYTAIANGSVSLDAKINKGKTLYVVDSDGTVLKSVTADINASLYDTVTFDVTAGKTYYAYVSGSKIQIWQAKFSPISEAEQTPWDEVEAPKVTSIEESGMNLVVNFEGNVDSITGADDLQVTLYYEQDGTYYEVDTVTIKNNTTKSATFTPLWSGNYKAVVAAERAGEAVKYSDEVFKTGYILAVKEPVIESIITNDDGTVYLDWLNLEDADKYDVYAKSSDSENYELLTSTEDANATVTLAEGTYDFKINATRNSDGYVATTTKTSVEINKEDDRVWNIATVGSAQETNAVITTEAGTESINISSKDSATEKVGLVEDVTNVANTSGSIEIAGASNGKISDGEEGFQYYYTTVNPNTENFKLSATFTITDTSLTPDNQTGFGIIACDMLGYNFWGTPDYVHKYFNSVSTQMFSAKAGFIGQRIITGYSSIDTTDYTGVTRTTNQQKANGQTANFTTGASYEFTLEKTNDAWVSTVNGVEVSSLDLSCLTVQEDGSITIGVFVARKVSVNISDIKFETSDSTGVGEASDSSVSTASGRIYSTNISSVKDYEFIYSPTASGNIVVYNVDGSVAYEGHLAANEVLRTTVELTSATNTIKYDFTPDGPEVQELTSYQTLQGSITVSYKTVGNVNEILYVSADGSTTAAGTKEDPMDLQTAVNYAQPGQYILMLNGTYKGNSLKISRSMSGTADKHIKLVAETAGEVIFDGMGISLTGSYWDIYGIHVYYPNAVGIQVGGNYNTIEMCTVEGSKNTGIQISRVDGAEREAGLSGLLWPSYNLIKNCESFDNCDSGRNDADGFAAKLTSGEGNVFYGCIGHNNIDDGWDLFAKTISGEIGEVQIINCVAYNNGWLTTDDITAAGYEFGEGNGFKLGGSYMKGGHVLKNSVTFGNVGKGITSNSCPDCKVYNCTSYGNAVGDEGVYNVGLNTKDSLVKEWIVSGLISVTSTENSTTADLVPYSLLTENNYLYNGSESRNNQGVVVTDDWFENVDLTNLPTRNEDGTINMHGLLVLTSSAPSNSGARLDVTSDAAKSLQPTFEAASVVYEMLDGADQTIEKGQDLVLRSSADLSKFEMLKIDGVIVDEENYTLASGSTIVTVKAAYLNTLADGSHSVEIVSTDGNATTNFTLVAAATVDPAKEEVAADTDHITGEIEVTEIAADSADVSAVVSNDAATSETATTDKNTADTNPVLPLVIMLTLSMGAVVLVKKRRIEE